MIGPAATVAERPRAYRSRRQAASRGGRNALGRLGEEAAARRLASQGYRILERGYTTRAGEIDLVAEEGGALVFVEVKTRSCVDRGRPAEAVDARKRSHLLRAAELYLMTHDGMDRACRFDVVEIIAAPSGSLRIEVIRDAFQAS